MSTPPPPGPPPVPAPQPVPGQPKPDNYLVWAILTTLFCCLPFGIVSIVYAAKVDGLFSSGQYAEAQQASDNAKKWAVISAIVGVVVLILYVLLFVVLGVFSTTTTTVYN